MAGFYDIYRMFMGWWNQPPVIVRTQHGRQGIGVVQPQAGIDFPIVQPSEDIRYLLADFHISFDQPSDYSSVPPFKLPFRVYWLSGFGNADPGFEVPTQGGDGSWSSVCVSQSSSGSIDCLPIPRNGRDIIIVDADDRVVFDSTHPDVSYETRAWTDRLRIVVWRHPTDQTVSLVYHTAWNPTDSPEPKDYPSYFFPEEAVLDERVVARLPKRLRSLTVVLDNMRKTAVEFVAGYNMRIDADATQEPDGGRRTTRVTFNAVPGAGLGVFPDCTTPPLNIGSINGVLPTTAGDFYMAATDCYWIRQPTRVISESPLVTIPEINLTPGSVPTAGMPSANAGSSKTALGWPNNDDPRYAHLQFGNDCEPCCDCPDYVDAARYMNRTRDKYHDLGENLEVLRDLYHSNRERWLSAADCLNRKPLRIRLLPQSCPFLDVSIQFCNQTGACLNNIELSVTFTTSPAGGTAVEVPGFTFITGARRIPGRTAPATDRYQMGGSWPTFTAFFDSAQPGQSVHARFRLSFGDCGMSGGVAYAVTGTLTGSVDGDPVMVNNTDEPPVLVAATAVDTQTLNCPAVDTSLNLLACACG